MSRVLVTCRPFAALHEDTDKGWVWMFLDKDEGFYSRMTIKISTDDGSVYCEYRVFDENFVRRYDASDDTTSMYFATRVSDHAKQKEAAQDAVRHRQDVDLKLIHDVMVISGWYRRALGYPTVGHPHTFTITKPLFSMWADLRASCQHPEPGVRIATRVGLLGAWLGVAAFLPAVVEMSSVKTWLEPCLPNAPLIAWILVVCFGLACIFAGRGIKAG